MAPSGEEVSERGVGNFPTVVRQLVKLAGWRVRRASGGYCGISRTPRRPASDGRTDLCYDAGRGRCWTHQAAPLTIVELVSTNGYTHPIKSVRSRVGCAALGNLPSCFSFSTNRGDGVVADLGTPVLKGPGKCLISRVSKTTTKRARKF